MASKKRRAKKRAKPPSLSSSLPQPPPEIYEGEEAAYVRIPVSPRLVQLVRVALEVSAELEREITRAFAPKKRG